jgi:hypothetical protein
MHGCVDDDYPIITKEKKESKLQTGRFSYINFHLARDKIK